MTENKDEINTELINLVTEDFNRVYKNLYFASNQIIKKGFSKYPIFIMTKENTDIGSLLIDFHEINNNQWKYYASYFENLHKNKLIIDKETFIKNFKDPNIFCSLLLSIEKNAKFVFVPYKFE